MNEKYWKRQSNATSQYLVTVCAVIKTCFLVTNSLQWLTVFCSHQEIVYSSHITTASSFLEYSVLKMLCMETLEYCCDTNCILWTVVMLQLVFYMLLLLLLLLVLQVVSRFTAENRDLSL